ncbi:TD and POZ domain-containing protein 4 [Caerostris darwini]|uniref:TD and POZ domain-containing protein 4 n=1 Tax=Caerostris darwini TaxID=1538125 RepID=A0AAV4VVE4_9ARAC|nr:TD and POZ domain-containing protein 4 [Caerostris darwini]
MASKRNGGTKYFEFHWTIENFSIWWQRTSCVFPSPSFVVNEMENTKWNLWMKHKELHNKYRIAIYLNREKDSIDLDISLGFRFTLLAEDETVLISSPKAENCVFQKGTSFAFHLGADELNRYIEMQTTHPCNIKAVCRMWYGEGELIDIGNCFGLTRFEIETFCFSWTINDFSYLNSDKNAKVLIKSHLNKPLMTFILYLTKEEKSGKEILNIDIMTHQNTRIATFESSIQDVDGNKHFCGKEDYDVQGKGKIGTFKLKQTKQELVESKNIFLKDNFLSLNCECTICTGIYYATNEKHDFGVISSDSRTEIFKSTPRIPSSNLQNDLMSMTAILIVGPWSSGSDSQSDIIGLLGSDSQSVSLVL